MHATMLDIYKMNFGIKCSTGVTHISNFNKYPSWLLLQYYSRIYIQKFDEKKMMYRKEIGLICHNDSLGLM